MHIELTRVHGEQIYQTNYTMLQARTDPPLRPQFSAALLPLPTHADDTRGD